MKKFLNISILLICLCVIIILLILIFLRTKQSVRNIADIKEYMKKVETEKIELANNECILQTEEKQVVVEKPEKNARFGILKIPSIEVELDMMNGTSKSLLSQGVGFDSNSYLPGEGGSIVLMGHNFKQFLARLPEAQIGDEVILETNYGEFHYNICDAKIVKENDVSKVPIQKYEEIVMIYTCWPIPNVTHANDRYVIYAK